MKWKTITEVAKILPNNATVTRAKCTDAVDATEAICSLARSGSMCFYLDGNLIEDSSRNTTKKRHKMREEFGGRWRMQEEEISRLSRSRSSSVHVDISDSGSVEEMSQKHYKLGAKPKWSAHADLPKLSEDSSTTPIPPWRDKSLWRITTTKTVGGLLSDQPNQGVKQKFQGLYEAMSRKHAMEYARLTKDYEDMARASEKEEEEEVTKDEELHRKMEEMLPMKDMAEKTNVFTSDPRYQ